MKLEKDLYAYLWNDPYENNCNTYVVTGDVTVLVDPGHSKFLDRLFAQMEEDGLSPDSIDLVIITHAHPDHFEGVEAFLDKAVKIAIGQEEERYLLDRGKVLFEMMRQPLPKFRIDFYLKEGKLNLGREELRYHPDPRSFSGIPLPLLAGEESALHRGRGLPWGDRQNGFSGRRFQRIDRKHRKALSS